MTNSNMDTGIVNVIQTPQHKNNKLINNKYYNGKVMQAHLELQQFFQKFDKTPN